MNRYEENILEQHISQSNSEHICYQKKFDNNRDIFWTKQIVLQLTEKFGQ